MQTDFGTYGSKLQLGSQLADTQTGVILNGASLEVTEIAFGAADLYVYTSADNGTIDGDLSGSGAVVSSGPGTTTLECTSSYTGGTHVHTGALVVANTPSPSLDGGVTRPAIGQRL